MKRFSEFVVEDGAGGGGAAPVGVFGVSGAAPTNSVRGLASIYNPDGSIASPPVGKRKQKSIQQRNADDEKEYVKSGFAKMRRVLKDS